MGDVKKDVETMERIKASGNDSLKIMADLTETVIKVFYHRLKKENPALGKMELLKKLHEDLYYGRKDNP